MVSSKRGARRSRRAGFTVVELVIVVAIIGIMSAAIAPSISSMVADGRQAAAAADVLRLGRLARARALETRTAHLLRFDASTANGHGTLQMWPGMNSRCRQTPWQQAFTANPASLLGQPIETLDMIAFQVGGNAGSSTSDTGRHVVTLRARRGATPQANLDVCVQPNGHSYTMAWSGGGESTLTPQAAPVVFTVDRYVTEGATQVPHGVARDIIFPIGGNPRMRI